MVVGVGGWYLQGDYYQNSGPLQFEGPTADSR